VHGAAHVQHHRRPTLLVALVLAHGELVPSGRRRPVHPAEVVTDDVRAQRVELVPARLQARRAPAVGVDAIRAGGRGDDVDGGVHDERRRRGGHDHGLGQPEGVTQLDLEGADGDDAPAAGGQPVGGPDPGGGLQRGQEQLGPGRPADPVPQDQHRGAATAPVADEHVHPAGLTGVHPVGVQGAHDLQPQ
jgi:hypothetical protein